MTGKTTANVRVKGKLPKDKALSFEGFVDWWKKNRKYRSEEENSRKLKEEIQQYEKKYQMSTSEFIRRYEKGEFEMDDNYNDFELSCWLTAYRAFQKRSKASDSRRKIK